MAGFHEQCGGSRLSDDERKGGGSVPKMVLRRIGALSLAKVMSAIYGAMGLVIGAIVAVFSLFGAAVGAGAEESA